MEDYEYYDMALMVGDDLEAIERHLFVYGDLWWEKLKKVCEDIGRLRTESSNIMAREISIMALESWVKKVIYNIRIVLYDMGGIAHDD